VNRAHAPGGTAVGTERAYGSRAPAGAASPSGTDARLAARSGALLYAVGAAVVVAGALVSWGPPARWMAPTA
jgi:hypothetical protein